MEKPKGQLNFSWLEPKGSTPLLFSNSQHKMRSETKHSLPIKFGETQFGSASGLPFISAEKQKAFFASRISHTLRKHTHNKNVVKLKTPLKLSDLPRPKSRFSLQRVRKNFHSSASSFVLKDVKSTLQSLGKEDSNDIDTFDFLRFASVKIHAIEPIPSFNFSLLSGENKKISFSFDLEKRVLCYSNLLNEDFLDENDDPMDVDDECGNTQTLDEDSEAIGIHDDNLGETSKLKTIESDHKSEVLHNNSELFPTKKDTKEEQYQSIDIGQQSDTLSKTELNLDLKSDISISMNTPQEEVTKSNMTLKIIQDCSWKTGKVDSMNDKVEELDLISSSCNNIEQSSGAKETEYVSRDESVKSKVTSGSSEILEDGVCSLTTLEVVETILAMRNRCIENVAPIVRQGESEIIDLTDSSIEPPSENSERKVVEGGEISCDPVSSFSVSSKNNKLQQPPKHDQDNEGELLRNQYEQPFLSRPEKRKSLEEVENPPDFCKKNKTIDNAKSLVLNTNAQFKEETNTLEVELKELKFRHDSSVKQLKDDLDTSTKLNVSLSAEIKELRCAVEQMRSNMSTIQKQQKTVTELKSNITKIETAFLQASRKSEKTLVESEQLKESVKLLNGAVCQLETEKAAAESEARIIAESARKSSNYAKQLVARAHEQVAGAENEAFRLQKVLQDETYRNNKLTSQASVVRKQLLQAAFETSKWDEGVRYRIENLDAKLRKLEEQKMTIEERQKILKAKRLANAQKQKEAKKAQIKSESCIICFSKPVSIVFVPCGHRSVCPDCAPRMKRCPICRQDIQMQIKSFDAGIERT